MTLVLPRLYLNGFPKSGLHLAELMVGSIFQQAFPDWNWYGTNAWNTEPKNLDKSAKLAIIQPGSYLKGHSGYSEDIKNMLIGLQIGMVFIYRDLRDVAVSQTYHILSDRESLMHPAREYYAKDFNTVLKQVISGINEYDGLLSRWKIFSPWMDKFWVLPVRYDEMLKRPEKAAGRFFDYFHRLAVTFAGKEEIKIDKDVKTRTVKRMVGKMRQRQSITFRKGKTGEWRYEFKKEHADLFKEHDTDNVLLKLGFEKNKDWH